MDHKEMNAATIDRVLSVGADIMKEMQSPSPHFIRILLVDDSEDDYLLLNRALAKASPVQYRLDWEVCENRALPRLMQNAHDLYLIDFKLTNNEGHRLIHEAVSRGCKGPFAIFTGHPIDYVTHLISDRSIPIVSKNNYTNPKEIDHELRQALSRHRCLSFA